VLAGRSEPHLSLSRSGSLAVVAICDLAPVGVDVERADAAGPESTVTWVRTEALLKATGHGLRLDPGTVELSGPDQEPELVRWPEPPAPAVRLHDIETAPGFVAAVAVLTTDPVRVLVSPAGPGAAHATATP
jgi:4'-phosphopantetheinyl transferase